MRQAVVVIHGMGEQRPLNTLRSFISAAVQAPAEPTRPLYWSKPDAFGDQFELRRFVVASTHSRPITDMFEYYWADKMSGTKLRQLRPLARALLVRPPWRVSGSLLAFYLLGWLLVLTLVALALRVANHFGPVALLDSVDLLKKLAEGRTDAVGWLVLGVLLVSGMAMTFAVNTFGDVARYLDAAPGNVGVRHAIKADGLQLLRRIQDSGDYDRIVVVGHSLGSIIALDLLGYLWGEEYAKHAAIDRPKRTALQVVEKLGAALADTDSPTKEQVEQFQTAQRELWVEQRRLGNPWLITDLVGAGSPLAHAALLLAPTKTKLLERQARWELPRNPPLPDDGKYSHNSVVYTAGWLERANSLKVLNSGAMFAVTRWTNIWFPCRFGLFGDPFGGAVRPTFGNGVRDLPITGGRWWRFIPVFPHVAYWRGTSSSDQSDNVALLREALDLDSADWLAEVRPPRVD